LRTCEELLAVDVLAFATPNTTGYLQAQCNVAVTVLVVLLEHVRHALQTDAGLDKQIKAHGVVTSTVVGTVEQSDEPRRQTVAKGDEGFVELGVGYAARVIGVEAVEQAAPCRKKSPKTTVQCVKGRGQQERGLRTRIHQS
jgi:hypothetical protein